MDPENESTANFLSSISPAGRGSLFLFKSDSANSPGSKNDREQFWEVALVQGKLGETLYVDRVADGERFEIQIPTLSLQDRFFAMRLEEGAPPSVVVEKVVDPFIASRTKQIAELKDKEILLKQEIKSGTLSGILAAKRKEDLAATIEDLKKLDLAIQDYKYRNRKK